LEKDVGGQFKKILMDIKKSILMDTGIDIGTRIENPLQLLRLGGQVWTVDRGL